MSDIYHQEHTHPTSGDVSNFLDLTSCGLDRAQGEEKVFETAEYTMLFVIKGAGLFDINSKEIELSAGDAFLSRPHEAKLFKPSGEETCEYYWFCFRGRIVAEMLSTLKLTSRDKYFIGHDNEFNFYMDKIIDEYAKEENASEVIAASLTIAMLGQFSRLAVSLLPQDQIKGHHKIAPAISSINSDCTSKMGVDDYAKMCNLSTSYFTHLFTKLTGFSPMEYKQLQRINIAKNLLSTTNLSIKEISNVVGFKDPLYFGRCFKQATGHTPSGYRTSK